VVTADGLDEQRLEEAHGAAKEGCPVSKALAGNVEITLDAASADRSSCSVARSAVPPLFVTS
jgi:uncharacterized OsmC-like protein